MQERVVIAGAGPVGLTLSLALRREGVPVTVVPVTVVEAGPTFCQEFRAPAFHSPTLDMLDTLGVAARMKEIGLIVPVMRFTDRALGRQAELDMGILQERGLTAFPFDLILGQVAFARIAYERAVAAGIEFLFDRWVESADQDGSNAWLDCGTPAGRNQITSQYMVGCEGARSQVRKSLPVDFEGFTWPERFLMIHVNESFEAALGSVNFLANGPDWRLVLKIPYGPGADQWVSRVVSALPTDMNESEVAARAFLQSRLSGLIPGTS